MTTVLTLCSKCSSLRTLLLQPKTPLPAILKGFRGRQASVFLSELSFRRNNGMNVFDQETKIHQKNVAARGADHHLYDYLRVEVLLSDLSAPSHQFVYTFFVRTEACQQL